MKKIKLLKLICFFMVILLDIIFIISVKSKKIISLFNAEFHAEFHAENNIFQKIIIIVFIMLSLISSYFFMMGILAYIGFKISKGEHFVYKDPNKGKKLENIHVSQSISDYLRYNHTRGYNPPSFSSFLHSIFGNIPFVFNIILLIISIIIKCHWLKISSLVILIIFAVYIVLRYGLSYYWVIYVKFFKWLGFSWFEKDFNKTIAKNNYFLISEFYYEKQKQKEKMNKK